MRCGFTDHFAPTNGCFTRKILQICTARGGSRGDLYSNATARLLPRLRRRVWCASAEKPETTMKRLFAAYFVLTSIATAALGASDRQPAPPSSFEGAPAQYTHFSAAE